ncbi:unnamed protein product [Macrosiphum euphorbiae]|uniref:Uncharacterized protein n=1 Tax=Macrosiphum euphorbiae TaxID=13131 RepID=A0AAV0WNQ3_9HEMI|nr:unnamed protein product [Macrosiphum euphorbiae]
MAIQNMEWTIFETVNRKTMTVRPMILLQLDQITEYFKNDYNIEKDATLEDVVAIIKGIHIELISTHVPKNKHSFINQIKLLATDQLASSWMEKLDKSLKGVKENYGPEDFFSPPFTQLHRPCKQPKKTVNDEYDGPGAARDETTNLKDFFETYDQVIDEPDKIADENNCFTQYLF